MRYDMLITDMTNNVGIVHSYKHNDAQYFYLSLLYRIARDGTMIRIEGSRIHATDYATMYSFGTGEPKIADFYKDLVK